MAASFLNGSSTATTFSFISKPKARISCQSYRPMKVCMSLNHSWVAINSEVEAHIEKALSGRQPSSVLEPMNHLIFEVPRSMAPALCLAACETVGGTKEQAIPAASAIHLMHAAMYTHEYLPLSDQTKPKSKPMKAEHTFEPKVELLSADSMVPFGYELLAGTTGDSERLLKVMKEIGHAMGSEGMVNGQFLKNQYMGLDGDEAQQEGMIEEVFAKKGGGLYSCGAACGAILGGGSDEEIERLRKYGLYVGMIHNIMVHDGPGSATRLLKLADRLRFLALKELDGLGGKDVGPISSIMDGFATFLRLQKYDLPLRKV